MAYWIILLNIDGKVTICFGAEGERAGRVSAYLGYTTVHYDLTSEEDAQLGNAANNIVGKFNAKQSLSQNDVDALVVDAAISFNRTRLEDFSNESFGGNDKRLKNRDGFVKECEKNLMETLFS
ncbi:MAG: hypothetical protein GY804_13745 [Alphaproteobacteria bacterium]|nr:hypothetical protein [Alphaproteobacteria bacterium]